MYQISIIEVATHSKIYFPKVHHSLSLYNTSFDLPAESFINNYNKIFTCGEYHFNPRALGKYAKNKLEALTTWKNKKG